MERSQALKKLMETLSESLNLHQFEVDLDELYKEPITALTQARPLEFVEYHLLWILYYQVRHVLETRQKALSFLDGVKLTEATNDWLAKKGQHHWPAVYLLAEDDRANFESEMYAAVSREPALQDEFQTLRMFISDTILRHAEVHEKRFETLSRDASGN